MASVAGGIFPNGTSLESLLPEGCDADKIRKEVESLFEKKTRFLHSEKRPVLINLSGLPASGKTFRSKKIRRKHPDLLYIGFDEIMESLDEYKKDFARDPKKAFERWELPARWIGYNLLDRAVNKKFPVLFEHSNANPKHLDLYRNIINEGYFVEMRFIDAPPETVLPRLKKRSRYFPEQQVTERWQVLQKLLPDYKTAVSKFIVLKGNIPDPKRQKHLKKYPLPPKNIRPERYRRRAHF